MRERPFLSSQPANTNSDSVLPSIVKFCLSYNELCDKNRRCNEVSGGQVYPENEVFPGRSEGGHSQVIQLYVRFLILEQQQLCHEIQQTDDDKYILQILHLSTSGQTYPFFVVYNE